jgi:hypothetical protein
MLHSEQVEDERKFVFVLQTKKYDHENPCNLVVQRTRTGRRTRTSALQARTGQGQITVPERRLYLECCLSRNWEWKNGKSFTDLLINF